MSPLVSDLNIFVEVFVFPCQHDDFSLGRSSTSTLISFFLSFVEYTANFEFNLKKTQIVISYER